MAYDVVVIGAGVVGTAIARSLSQFDLEIAVLDAAHDVGQGTSKANTAILHTGFDATPGTLESRLVRRGYHLLRDYARETGIPLEPTGAILVAWDDEQYSKLAELKQKAESNEYRNCTILSAEEVYRAIPSLGPGALGGLSVPDEAIICPWSPTIAFATEAVENGVDLLLGHAVTEVDCHVDGVTTLHTVAGPVRTRWVINAAGLGADAIDRSFGYDRFAVTPRRGQLLVFDKQARPLTEKIVLPVPSALGKGVLISPTVYGNIMLGPTAEDLDDKSATQTTQEGFDFLLEKGKRIIPALLDEEVTASYAGLRASINQGDYLVSRDDTQRYVLVGGIRSTGLTAAMAIGEYLVDFLDATDLELTPKNEVSAPPTVNPIGERSKRPFQRPELIAKDPAYGEIVCFCERATRGEIRDALRGAVAAVDRAGVSRRTRATNGRCQGFYCGAEVEAMISQAKRDVHGF